MKNHIGAKMPVVAVSALLLATGVGCGASAYDTVRSDFAKTTWQDDVDKLSKTYGAGSADATEEAPRKRVCFNSTLTGGPNAGDASERCFDMINGKIFGRTADYTKFTADALEFAKSYLKKATTERGKPRSVVFSHPKNCTAKTKPDGSIAPAYEGGQVLTGLDDPAAKEPLDTHHLCAHYQWGDPTTQMVARMVFMPSPGNEGMYTVLVTEWTPDASLHAASAKTPPPPKTNPEEDASGETTPASAPAEPAPAEPAPAEPAPAPDAAPAAAESKGS